MPESKPCNDISPDGRVCRLRAGHDGDHGPRVPVRTVGILPGETAEAINDVEFFFDGFPPGDGVPHQAWSTVKIALWQLRSALHAVRALSAPRS